MKMVLTKRLTALFAVALVAAACGDDTGVANSGSSSNTFVSNNQATDAGTADDAAPVVDAGDVPDANDDVDMGTAMVDSGDSAGPQGPEPVEVEWPATVEDFVSTATYVSYVSKLSLPATDPSGYPACCGDFGDRSKRPGPDNALASLMAQIVSLNPDSGAETLLQDSVEEGRVVLLLDHRAFEGTSDADGYALSWIDGGWTDESSWETAAAGGASFFVDPDSFVDGTGQPRSVMNPAILNDGTANAGPATLRLTVPVGFALVPLDVHEASITGVMRKNEAGVAYSEGDLSGYAETSEIFGALNQIVSANCDCLGLEEPGSIYSQSSSGNWSGTCTPMAHVACPEPEQEVCRVLGGASVIDGGYCGVLPQILQNAADIDSDQDGAWDSVSIGLEWSAVPAKLR